MGYQNNGSWEILSPNREAYDENLKDLIESICSFLEIKEHLYYKDDEDEENETTYSNYVKASLIPIFALN